MSEPGDLAAWFRGIEEASTDRDGATHDAYQRLENADLVRRVVVHRYQCHKCFKVLGTVVSVGDRIICRTTPYKFSPGLNEARSVAAAREKNTLDGERFWPGHTFDVTWLAEWGPDMGIGMNCRHVTHTVKAVDILERVKGVKPGHPGKPTIL